MLFCHVLSNRFMIIFPGSSARLFSLTLHDLTYHCTHRTKNYNVLKNRWWPMTVCLVLGSKADIGRARAALGRCGAARQAARPTASRCFSHQLGRSAGCLADCLAIYEVVRAYLAFFLSVTSDASLRGQASKGRGRFSAQHKKHNKLAIALLLFVS